MPTETLTKTAEPIIITITLRSSFATTHPEVLAQLEERAFNMAHRVLNVHDKYRPYAPPTRQLNIFVIEQDQGHELTLDFVTCNPDLLEEDRPDRERMLRSYFDELYGLGTIKVRLQFVDETTPLLQRGERQQQHRLYTATPAGPHGHDDVLEQDIIRQARVEREQQRETTTPLL